MSVWFPETQQKRVCQWKSKRWGMKARHGFHGICWNKCEPERDSLFTPCDRTMCSCSCTVTWWSCIFINPLRSNCTWCVTESVWMQVLSDSEFSALVLLAFRTRKRMSLLSKDTFHYPVEYVLVKNCTNAHNILLKCPFQGWYFFLA